LLRAEEIGHHSDNFEIEFFNLVAGEDRLGIALQSGPNLIDWKSFIRLGRQPQRDECNH